MKSEIKKISQTVRQVTIKIDAKESMEAYRKKLKKISKYASVAGFRKGKAPLNLVETAYGEAIKGEFEDSFAKENYKKLLEEKKINSVSPGSIKEITWEKDKKFIVTYTYETDPELKKISIKGIKVPFEAKKVLKKDVDGEIDKIREKMATKKEINTPCEKNDLLKVKMSFERSKPFDRELMVGSTFYGKNFERDIEGKKKGYKFSSEIDMSEKKDKSKIKKVNVEIISVARKFLPTLDNEFAKDAEFSSLDEMKKEIRKNLKVQTNKMNINMEKEAIIGALLEKNPFEVPEFMVDYYASNMAKNYSIQYKMAAEQLKPLFIETAKKNLQTTYLMSYFRKKFAFEVPEEEKEKFILSKAKEMSMEIKDFKEKYSKYIKENVESEIIEEKIFEKIKKDIKFISPANIKKEKKDKK